MNKKLCAAILGLGAASFSQFANAQTVTLDPGLYEYVNVINFGGLEMPDDTSEICIKPGENSKTLEELAAALSGNGKCTVSNGSQTESTARAEFFCTGTQLGMDISGTMEARYGSDFYDIDSRAALGPLGEILVKTTIKRLGDCAAPTTTPN